MAMGTTISNEVFIEDLAKMPHLLVAGATGQGKSVEAQCNHYIAYIQTPSCRTEICSC